MFQQLVGQALDNLNTGKDELGLLSIMPLFDKACSKIWPKVGVGKRFRDGVTKTEDIITFFMTKGSVFIECRYGDLTLPQIIYKYLRNSVLHDGVMPRNINFIDENKIIIDKGSVSLPRTISHGLLLAAVGFECYEKEQSKSEITASITLEKHKLLIKDCIGDHTHVRDFIRKFGMQCLA